MRINSNLWRQGRRPRHELVSLEECRVDPDRAPACVVAFGHVALDDVPIRWSWINARCGRPEHAHLSLSTFACPFFPHVNELSRKGLCGRAWNDLDGAPALVDQKRRHIAEGDDLVRLVHVCIKTRKGWRSLQPPVPD